MMMNLIFLKKLFFWIFYLLVLTILFENVKVKVWRHTDVYFETKCPHFGLKKKLLASSLAMFKLSHKIMYVRRIVHKQFKIAYPPLLAICKTVKLFKICLLQE